MQLSRFYRSLGLLVQGGIPLVTALGTSKVLLHSSLKTPLEQATEDISTGAPFSASLHQHGLTTPVALRMLRVGERSGRLGEMLEHVAEFHDDDTERWLDMVTRVFPPILLLLIALFVGSIVILMYLPIFDLAGSLQ